jgi:hypothetical protein
VKIKQHFRGTYHLHLQGQRVSQAKNENEEAAAVSFLLVFLLGLFFNPEAKGDMFL